MKVYRGTESRGCFFKGAVCRNQPHLAVTLQIEKQEDLLPVWILKESFQMTRTNYGF